MSEKSPKIIDGIECYCPDVQANHEDYHATGLDNVFRSESSYFWFIARCEMIADVFKRHVKKSSRIIEIGAGTGNVTRALKAQGYDMEVGELHLEGLKYAKSYGVEKCYQFDLYDPPFVARFDVVGMFDVLEHLQDETLALKQMAKMLKPGGKLILTVPAHMWLWNRADTVAGHKIRYTRRTIGERLERAGFKVEESRYFFVFITPLLYLRRVMNADDGSKVKESERHEDIKINPVINRLLLTMCRIENRLNRFLPNIFGGSIVVVASKLA